MLPRYTPLLVSLTLPQHITEFLQWTSVQLVLLPQVGCQESVTVSYSDEGGFEGVFEGLGAAGGGGVCVLHSGELEETLDGGGGDEAGTTGCWDQLEQGHVSSG